MSIRIDAQELRAILRLTPATQNIMLMGKQGIGKSEIITDFFTRERSMRVVPFFLGQMADPGDLIGLMHKDEVTGRSQFLPPYWWPADDEPIVLFLDELNRARPEILQAVQDLSLHKTLAGKRLPTGSVVIAAVNEGEEFQLTDLDPALVSRFNLYEFAPTVEDWLGWASERGVDPRIITFIQAHPEHLDGGLDEAELIGRAGLVKVPDRRAWARVSDLIAPIDELDDLCFKAVAGMVGAAATLALRTSIRSGPRVRPEDVLLGKAKDRKQVVTLPLGDLASLHDAILLWLGRAELDGRTAGRVRKNLQHYLELLEAEGKGEAVAHLASRIDDDRFEAAMAFLAEAPDTLEWLERYIDGIRVE